MPDPNRRNHQIFISYRREDNAGVTGRIHDRLVQKFGAKAIFIDIDSIPFGVNFKQHIDAIMQECDVVLVIMGDRWAGETRKPVRRRIDDPQDIFRIEIESALSRKIRVIPLLIQDASMPSEASLPDSLKGLAARHGTTIGNDPRFGTDMERLMQDLEEYFEILRGGKEDSGSQAGHLLSGTSRSDTSDFGKASALGRAVQSAETPATSTEPPTVGIDRSGVVRRRSLSWAGVWGYLLAVVIAVGFLAYIHSTRTDQMLVASQVQLVTQADLKTALRDAKITIHANGLLVQGVDHVLIEDKGKLRNFKAEVLMLDPLKEKVICARMKDEGHAETYNKILIQLAVLNERTRNSMGDRLTLGLTSAYPTIAVVMIDDDLYAYFYPYGTLGTDSPILKFSNYAKDERAKFFVDHYNKLRASAKILVQADFEEYKHANKNFPCTEDRPVTTPLAKPN